MTGSEEVAAVSALVEPWLYVGTVRQPFAGLVTSRIAAGPYDFEAVALPAPQVPGESPAAVRAALLARAEAALGALDEAGWQLTSYPRMSFDGRVRPRVQTLGGKLVTPAGQYGISLEMSFAVGRPR